jgi:hypothetical protein
LKITYERSGGVAGITKRAVVDTAALDPAQRGEWEALVRDASFFSLPGALPAANPQARDAFSHTVQVEEGGKAHTVSIPGTPAAGPLRELVNRLQSVAGRP